MKSVVKCVSLKCQLEVEHIAIEFDDIYLGVSILNTIRSRVSNTDLIYEGLIITTLTGKVIQTLIILNPESNIPGLIIRPTKILSVGQICLESGSHLVSLECYRGGELVPLILLGHFKWPSISHSPYFEYH